MQTLRLRTSQARSAGVRTSKAPDCDSSGGPGGHNIQCRLSLPGIYEVLDADMLLEPVRKGNLFMNVASTFYTIDSDDHNGDDS